MSYSCQYFPPLKRNFDLFEMITYPDYLMILILHYSNVLIRHYFITLSLLSVASEVQDL